MRPSRQLHNAIQPFLFLFHLWNVPPMMTAESLVPPFSLPSVVVMGGTHGNEYTGVWCIKALDRRLQKEAATVTSSDGRNSFPSLRISTLLGNPQVFQLNKRFVDEDLNRQFTYESLRKSPLSSEGDTTRMSLEAKRARELDILLGPKVFEGDEVAEESQRREPSTDVLIDLHTTTCNMGITLIVAEGDSLMTSAAAYVMMKLMHQHDVRILMHTHGSQRRKPHVSSIARHSFTIEVGPVPQGVLRHDMVEKTERALDAALEFLDRGNGEIRPSSPEVMKELRKHFSNGTVPCYRSAPAKVRGEMSAKISWPCDPENENFPAWIVHQSVQDKDFTEIRTGDPLFVDLEGNVLPYDGSHGSPVHLMFINEGGYYYKSSGTGISVAVRDQFQLETGQLLKACENYSVQS